MQNLEQFLTEKDRKDILLFDSSDTVTQNFFSKT